MIQKHFLSALAILLLLNTSAIGQAQKCKKDVVFAEDVTMITLQLDPKNITIKPINGLNIIVETTITIDNPNEKLLDYLVGIGRYDLIIQHDIRYSHLQISSYQENGILLIKGKEVEEKIQYLLYIPEHIHYLSKDFSFFADKK